MQQIYILIPLKDIGIRKKKQPQMKSQSKRQSNRNPPKRTQTIKERTIFKSCPFLSVAANKQLKHKPIRPTTFGSESKIILRSSCNMSTPLNKGALKKKGS